MSELKATLQRLKKLKEVRLNRNIITYLICVVIASILWFLNALNKDYTSDISYPVKYTNFPEDKYPVIQLPSKIQLEVKAKGFALLGHRIRTSFLPITLNVSSYRGHAKEKNGMLEFTLNTNDIKDKISNQLSTDIKLNNITPEEIVFKLANSVSKMVPVIPVVNYTLKRQYILNKITVAPDSIRVSGPAPFIDTLQGIPTQAIVLKNLSKDTKETTGLSEMPDCHFQDTKIEVYLQVEQFTEAKRTLPIVPLHVPDSLIIRLFPTNVAISYEIGLSKYDKVSNSDFVFAVDYPKTNDSPYLEIKMEKVPAFIKNLSFSPQKVEYIIERK